MKEILSSSVPRYEIASQGASSNLACVWWCGNAPLSAGLRHEAHGFDMLLHFKDASSGKKLSGVTPVSRDTTTDGSAVTHLRIVLNYSFNEHV